MKRAYYSSSISEFIDKKIYSIFGEITHNDKYSSENLQKTAWKKEIDILKKELISFRDGHILFEYTIPRIGKRIDCVILHKGAVFLLEFKVNEKRYNNYDIEQVVDYALDLNCFHKESHDKLLVPILVCTEAPNRENSFSKMKDNILEPVYCNKNNIASYIKKTLQKFKPDNFNYDSWINSIYMPTPTIVEAAQTLYKGHQVSEISRSDATAKNLNQTTKAINDIIDFSKLNNRKSICFVTGVPGAGKTLAGLNIAIERQKTNEEEHAVFLSGNGPLVDVLQEALARDDCKQRQIKKEEAKRKSKAFIQIIHKFRDEAISAEGPPIEKVVIFDEAQRAWDESTLKTFMSRKKDIPDFDMSEPEFLIGVMDKHNIWTTIICLVGGGQEINKGEYEGLNGWFKALRKKYKDWDIYVSDKITDQEYSKGISIEEMTKDLRCKLVSNLHLAVSLRSFRNENVSAFVKALLDVEKETARALFEKVVKDYPIYLTRDFEKAKNWVRSEAKGSQRYGVIASSGAKRLRKYGIWVQNKIDAANWFLNYKNDVRSSFFLEETATEFDIQGLELDYTIMCWDANLRFNGKSFEYCNFIGSKWQSINKEENKLYLQNAYRVLLTRARQGFIIFIPDGDNNDLTMLPEYYNGIYKYLQEIGIEEI